MDGREAISAYVTPRHYELELRNLDFSTWKYQGKVTIQAEIHESHNTITLNARRLNLESAQVVVGGAVVADATGFDHNTDETVILIFDKDLPVSQESQITIQYEGTISDSLDGFYRSKYKPATEQAASVPRDDEGSCHLLVTHFQHNFACQAFPCFDVPHLKATFDVSIEVPSDQTALGNMPIKSTEPSREGWNNVFFETTPRMSTYLVAWAIGDLEYTEALSAGKLDGRRIPIRTYTVRGLVDQTALCADVAPKALDIFTELFAIPYPLEKLDILAVPEMSIFGMENWGLITCAPQGVLFDPEISDETSAWIASYNISHEIAHQWFGNLVTMPWWDELWLNEGFATWAGMYAINAMHPEWSAWSLFGSELATPTMRQDGLRSTHPVHIVPKEGMQVHQLYDDISYTKACCVLRMVVRQIGIDAFSRGVSSHLKQNLYGNASASSLWAALDAASGEEIGSLAEAWIHKPGHPVLTVTEDAEKDELVVTQNRYMSSGDVTAEEDETIWHVPLWIEDGSAEKRSVILTARRQVIPGVNRDRYTINSEGVGFYHVNYPPERLAKFGEEHETLIADFKIGLLSSTMAFVAAGVASTSSLFSLLEKFSTETSYSTWSQILTSILRTRRVFMGDERVREGVNAFSLRLAADVKKKVEEAAAEDMQSRSLRQELQLAAIDCNDEETINVFSKRFWDWADHGAELDAVSRPIAYRAALCASPAETFARMRTMLRESTSTEDKFALLGTMSRVPDTGLRQELLDFSFAASSKEAVSMTELNAVVLGMRDGSAEAQRELWEYVRSHWEDRFLAKVSDPPKQDDYLGIVLGGLVGQDSLDDVECFFGKRDSTQWASILETAKEGIKNRTAQRERDLETFTAWLVEHGYTL